MTDKQIILNGVDVLKEKINICFILLLNKLETSETIEQTIYEHLDVFVEEWNKQLKDKEQECEELKEECRKYGKINEQETKDYAELKAENERLKKEIRLYNCIDKWGTEQCHCACRCLGNEFCDAAEEKIKNIKQTLENIKEIAKKTLNMVDYKTYFKRDNKSLKQEGFKALNEILQKISEVEK